VGRYRALDAGKPVDARGRIIESELTDGEFTGASELSALLAGSEEVARCFALQWMRFAYGLQESGELACALEQLEQSFVQSGGSIRELLLSTTRTAHFRVRKPGQPAPPALSEPEPSEPMPTAPPTPPSDLEVMVRTDSSWQAGHCDPVSVRNDSDMPLDWSVELTIDGTLTDHWNCNASATTGKVTFTGAEWNRSVAPGATAQFGYCVGF
jgi:cellulase/cellobiase CelA1